MAAAALPQVEPEKPKLIAPWWHTVLLVAIVLAISLAQPQRPAEVAARYGRMPLYISTMVAEWVLVAFIWLGVRRRGASLRALVGGRWSTPEDALLDVAIAGGFWIVSLAILAGVRLALGLITLNAAENTAKMQEMSRALGFMAPRSGTEMIGFLLLTLTAGFCEELIFRGYFQKQFALASGSAALGVVVQGILFGAAHGYQGWRLMVTIGVYGVLFGLLVLWRKSLRPGMIAHTGQDLIAGMVLRAFLAK